MRYQQLGSTGLFLSRLALGTSTFGGADNPLYSAIGGLGQPEANRIVGVALDAGINLFDSADVYAGGESEQRLGAALGARRKDVLVSTKLGNRSGPGVNDTGQSRVHVMQAIDASLRRLDTDWIDLLQLHTFDPFVALDDVLRSLDIAIRAGKVRYVGCSNYSGWQLTKAAAIAKELRCDAFVSVQSYYSVVGRDIEREVVPAALDARAGILTWSPLAGGLLTGKFNRRTRPQDESRRLRFDFPPVDLEHAWNVIDVLERIAARRGLSVPQLALAWQFHQPGITSAIVGARTPAQLEANLPAADLDLEPDELAEIDAVSRPRPEYPGWYHQLSLGRKPGEASRLSRTPPPPRQG